MKSSCPVLLAEKDLKNRDKSFGPLVVPPQIDPAKAEPTQSKWCCRITVQPAVDAYWKFVRVALVSPFKTAAAAALSPCRGSLGTGMPFTFHYRFTGRQQTDLCLNSMIFQSPQNVNTVCVFAFSMGESTALRLKLSF